jgi:glycerol-3-phosphate cytidylyltransferase-like family protein
MITRMMKRQIEMGEVPTERRRKRKRQMSEEKRNKMMRKIYYERAQKRIDRELDNLLWLCQNRPDIFLMGKDVSYPKNPDKFKSDRYRTLLLVLGALHPKVGIQLRRELDAVKGQR